MLKEIKAALITAFASITQGVIGLFGKSQGKTIRIKQVGKKENITQIGVQNNYNTIIEENTQNGKHRKR